MTEVNRDIMNRLQKIKADSYNSQKPQVERAVSEAIKLIDNTLVRKVLLGGTSVAVVLGGNETYVLDHWGVTGYNRNRVIVEVVRYYSSQRLNISRLSKYGEGEEGVIIKDLHLI